MPDLVVAWRGDEVRGHPLAFVKFWGCLPLTRGWRWQREAAVLFSLVLFFSSWKKDHAFFFFCTLHLPQNVWWALGNKCLARTHTHTFFFLSWMTLKWTWLKEKGESAGKTCRHGIRRQRRPLFMSRLQHSGETLEQWKYIESGRLLFSLGRTIIFGWLRTRVHI